MKKVAIIHGTKGSPKGNWFPWLKEKLMGRGHHVLIPQMPTPENQSLENWMKTFHSLYRDLGASSVLIGHSAGATFLLRVLSQVPTPIFASVFVAGLTGKVHNKEYDDLNATFLKAPYDWNTIKENAGHALCFIGEDDPYVPLSQGAEIASGLGIKPYIISGGGHLNSESGFTEFTQLFAELVKIGL